MMVLVEKSELLELFAEVLAVDAVGFGIVGVMEEGEEEGVVLTVRKVRRMMW